MLNQQLKEIASIRAPVKDRKEELGYRWETIEMLEPFSVIEYLWNTVGIDLDQQAVRTFWEEHRKRGTPWAVHSDADSDVIPLGLYGDACRIRQQAHQPAQKALGIFLNCPIFRPHSSRASRWLLMSIDEGLLYKRKTLNKIMARIVWSLNILSEDRYPACGPHGESFSGKFQDRVGQRITGKRFSVVELRGDWLHHKHVFAFNSTWQAGKNKPVCFCCPAYRSGECRYYNILETSPLWQRQYTLGQFLRLEMPKKDPSNLANFHVLAYLHSCAEACCQFGFEKVDIFAKI